MNRATAPKLIDVMHKALLSGDTRTVKKCLDDGFSVNGRLPTRNGRLQRETQLMIAAGGNAVHRQGFKEGHCVHRSTLVL